MFAPGKIILTTLPLMFLTHWLCSLTSLQIIHAIGFFNEPGTLESSSILIYSQLITALYTHWGWQDATIIKTVIKLGSRLKIEVTRLLKVLVWFGYFEFRLMPKILDWQLLQFVCNQKQNLQQSTKKKGKL